jgi:DHA2 family multidrug resistance protein
VAYIGIAPEKNNSVAGIINFMRNMGSSVGTSLVTTLIARRSQFHHGRLVQNARVDNPNFINAAKGLSQHFAISGVGKHEAQITAYATIYRTLQAQAATLGIHRYLYGALCRSGDHVLSRFCFEEERSRHRWSESSRINNQSDVMQGAQSQRRT